MQRISLGAIQSALDQHYPSLEIIAIDDGSTDGSLDIIRSFAGFAGVRWETGPNRGACIARNRGLALTAARRSTSCSWTPTITSHRDRSIIG